MPSVMGNALEYGIAAFINLELRLWEPRSYIMVRLTGKPSDGGVFL